MTSTYSGQATGIALVSGGLDSATALQWAVKEAEITIIKTVHFQYGQSHATEIGAAYAVCDALHIPRPEVIKINLEHLRGYSALLPKGEFDPKAAHETTLDIKGLPVSATYVPGRNIVMLALMGGIADAINARTIIGGWNAVDYSGYPDCRPQFISAMEVALRSGLRFGVDIVAPLLHLTKADIVRLAFRLNVPIELTWSCYKGGEKPCGECPSCIVRVKGFAEAEVQDPALL